MEVHLIRHTTPQVEKGVIYGQRLNVDVTDSFVNEAETLKAQISAINFDKVYSSPALRCVKLADHLFDKDYHIDQRLSEMDFGEWEGRKWDDIPQPELNEWMENYQVVSPPGGESMNQMVLRLNDFVKHIKGQNLSKVALVTHAGVIRILLSQYQNIPTDKMFEIKIGFGEAISVNI